MNATLRCLQEYIHHKIPVDAPCPSVRQAAYDSHPDCYVRGGICFLGTTEWGQIFDTIDPQDLEMKQAVATGLACAGNWLPLVFPATSLGAGGGFRGLMERDRQRMLQEMKDPPR